MNNKRNCNKFERELSNILFKHGYWVHRLTQNSRGQPADILSVKNCTAYLIDCKDCKNNKFSLSRIELNQELAMKLWKEKGNGDAWFALKLDSGIYMISHTVLFDQTKKNLNEKDISNIGIPLKEWIKTNENCFKGRFGD